MNGQNEFIQITDSRAFFEGNIRIPGKDNHRKKLFSAEAIGPRPKQDPLTLLRETERFHRYLQPETGTVNKVFGNIVRLRQGRKSWQQHRLTNHDLLLPACATNITARDMSVALILEMSASVLMLLRNKRCSRTPGDYFPLEDPQFYLKNDLDRDTMDTEKILDQLTMAITFELPDGGDPKPRQGQFCDTYHDDEQRSRAVMNFYYKFICGVPKKNYRGVYQKIGKLFSAIIQFLKRNNLVLRQYIQSSQQARRFTESMTNAEKEDIIQRREFPNQRVSIFTNIGFFESNKDEGLIKRISDALFRKQSYANKDAHKVRT